MLSLTQKSDFISCAPCTNDFLSVNYVVVELTGKELTHYHTIPHFDAPKTYSCGKHCGKHCEKRRNCLEQAISPFLTMFSTLFGTYFPYYFPY